MSPRLIALAGAYLVACGSATSLVPPGEPSRDGGTDSTSEIDAAPPEDAALPQDTSVPVASGDATLDANPPPPRDAASLLRPRVPLAGSPRYPQAIALSSDGLYVVAPVAPDAGALSTPEEIVRIALDGSSPPTIVATSSNFFFGLAVSDADVYYGSDQSLERLSKGSDGGVPVAATNTLPGPFFLAGGEIYYTTWSDDAQLYRIPAAGGVPFGLATNLYQPDGIALAGGGGLFVTEGGRLRLVPASGGAAQVLTSPAQEVTSFNGAAYFLDGQAAGILRETTAGGAPTPIAAGKSIEGFAVDASGVYFTDMEGLWRASVDGGDVALLSSFAGNGLYVPVALDATRVYLAMDVVYVVEKRDPPNAE